MFGGVGNYVINSDAFMGYVFPILEDEYIHVIDRTYYAHPYIVKMNWPILKKEIKSTDVRYLNPNQFAAVSRSNYGIVYLVSKLVKRRQLNIQCNIKLFIVNDSIWSDYNKFDVFYLSINNPYTNNFFYAKSNVLNIRDYDFYDILEYCEINKVSKIRLIPWLNGKYQGIIDLIKENKNTYPKEIYFYHFNKNDYKILSEK